MREKKQSEKCVDKVRARAGVCFGFCGQDAKVVGLFFPPPDSLDCFVISCVAPGEIVSFPHSA